MAEVLLLAIVIWAVVGLILVFKGWIITGVAITAVALIILIWLWSLGTK